MTPLYDKMRECDAGLPEPTVNGIGVWQSTEWPLEHRGGFVRLWFENGVYSSLEWRLSSLNNLMGGDSPATLPAACARVRELLGLPAKGTASAC